MKHSRLIRWAMPAVYLWRIIFPILFSLILLALAFYAFNYNDQGRDFFVGIIAADISLTYVVKSSLVLALWCFIIWYSNRMILQIKKIDAPADSLNTFFIAWLPRVLGITPYFIVIAALIRAARLLPEEDGPNLAFNIAVPAATALLMLLFFVFRSRIAKLLKINFVANDKRFSTERTTLHHFMQPSATRIAVITIIMVTAIMALLFFTPIKWGYARFLQPATVVLSGFIVANVVFTYLTLKLSPRRSPFFLLIIFYLLAASTFNNNTSIRTLPGHSPAQRMTVSENFTEWIRYKLETNAQDSIFPITIVAAEGGGIRAAAWTALTLEKLQKIDSSFMDHIYAVSGVSGGGVGACFYLAHWYDQLNGQRDTVDLLAAVSADFLSDVTAGFIYHDNLQRIIPFAINGLSRNRKLEDSWGVAYQRSMYSETMNGSFLALWNNSTRFRVPNLFINGLLAETGQKAITSNLELERSSVFRDDVDVLEELCSDIPLKTAASLCARFPVITSGALLKKNGDTPLGHILDGGYKENSGLETAWQLCLQLSPLVRQAEEQYRISLPLRILFIQNSIDGKTYDGEGSGPARVIPDLTTIIPGFLNAWDRRTTTYKDITTVLFRNPSMRERFSFYELRLQNQDRSLPLGWYLSGTAIKQIKDQVDGLKKPF